MVVPLSLKATTTMKNSTQSFFRPGAFSFVLRGRKVILGEVLDLRDGDVRITGNKRHGYLQVAVLQEGRLELLGGMWARKRHALPMETAQRVQDSLMALMADDYFVVLAAILAAEASERQSTPARLIRAIKEAVSGSGARRQAREHAFAVGARAHLA